MRLCKCSENAETPSCQQYNKFIYATKTDKVPYILFSISNRQASSGDTCRSSVYTSQSVMRSVEKRVHVTFFQMAYTERLVLALCKKQTSACLLHETSSLTPVP